MGKNKRNRPFVRTVDQAIFSRDKDCHRRRNSQQRHAMAVAGGGRCQLPDHLFRPYLAGALRDNLTEREREVLACFLKTLCDKKAATELGTSPQTVRNQLASIAKKLGCSSRVELVAAVVAALARG